MPRGPAGHALFHFAHDVFMDALLESRRHGRFRKSCRTYADTRRCHVSRYIHRCHEYVGSIGQIAAIGAHVKRIKIASGNHAAHVIAQEKAARDRRGLEVECCADEAVGSTNTVARGCQPVIGQQRGRISSIAAHVEVAGADSANGVRIDTGHRRRHACVGIDAYWCTPGQPATGRSCKGNCIAHPFLNRASGQTGYC